MILKVLFHIFFIPVYFMLLIIVLISWGITLIPYFVFLKSDIELVVKYTFNVMVSFDQTANAILLGDPDETISGRFGRRWANTFLGRAIDKVLGDGHIKQSIEPDEGKDDLYDRHS